MNVVRKFILALTLGLLTLSVGPAKAEVPFKAYHIPDTDFVRITADAPSPTIHVAAKPALKPPIRLPSSPLIIISRAQKPKPTPKLGDHLTYGVASYYCLTGISRCTVGHPGGLYAAIRRDLLFLRGKTIQVCTTPKTLLMTKCVFVRIIDCNCGPHANLIDLYSDAFKQLAPLRLGVVRVRIKW